MIVACWLLGSASIKSAWYACVVFNLAEGPQLEIKHEINHV